MNTVDKAVKILNKKYNINNIDYAIVVGSGLMKSAPDLENIIKVEYKDLGLPMSKVQGHSGAFVFGTFKDKKVVLVSRMHFYESGEIKKVRIPLEIVAKLNTKTVVLLTSCGGLNVDYRVGDVMLIDDHINMSGVNPLVGMETIKFTNMSNCYNKKLKDRVEEIAKQENIAIQKGIFCQMSGPSYETFAEVNMLRKLGGDAVSMSTAHDCIIARFLGMDVVGFSVIVNVFTGDDQNLSHAEVLENADKACAKVKIILSKLLI